MITRMPATADSGQVTLLLAPNRALSRRALHRLIWELGLGAFVVAMLAAWQGNVFAPLFALIEVPCFALALGLAWRAGERRERITLDGDAVRIEQVPPRGAAAASAFPAAWVKVQVREGGGHRHVMLVAQGREQEIGACLGDQERMQLSRWLRTWLSGRSGWRGD